MATVETAENEGRNQETLYLLSIPGMRESIHQGLKEPIEKCSETCCGAGSGVCAS